MSGQTTAAPIMAYGALQQGQQQSAILDQQASIQKQNATLALQAGQANAERQSLIAQKQQGAAVAEYGASGVTENSGSVLAVLGASAGNAELDRQNILHGAQVRAINYDNQASMDEYSAKNALTASYWNALGAVMGGGASSTGGGAKPASYPDGRGSSSYSSSDEIQGGDSVDSPEGGFSDEAAFVS